MFPLYSMLFFVASYLLSVTFPTTLSTSFLWSFSIGLFTSVGAARSSSFALYLMPLRLVHSSIAVPPTVNDANPSFVGVCANSFIPATKLILTGVSIDCDIIFPFIFIEQMFFAFGLTARAFMHSSMLENSLPCFVSPSTFFFIAAQYAAGFLTFP